MSSIDDALGLNPIVIHGDTVQYPAKRDEGQQENDLDFARENLYDAVVKSQAAVEDMILIAQQSQHPKAYEVLNSLIKTFADVSSAVDPTNKLLLTVLFSSGPACLPCSLCFFS